ncbi:type II secretion system protein [Hydrogenimonas sp.]
MRPAFTLLSAIFLMVLIAILLMLSLSLSSQTVKQTGDLYLKEQAQLLAKSSTEFALLAISAHENSTSCINRIRLGYATLFDIDMTLYYLGSGLPATCNTLDNILATKESNGTVMIDTVVTYTDPESNETVRFHRRTIQKP